MTDALNHLSAFNRIAYALENMPPDDQAALIAAIDAIANKTIPVADMSPVALAISNKIIPVTDVTALGTKLDTLNTTISNLSLGGGTSTGGSLDCNCLADVLSPLIDKIDQLICVIIPIANSQHQIEKIINYIGMDGPHLGIDAPPGSFIFPVPGDSTPSLPYTPNPSPTPTDPQTGAWVTPPIVDGIAYVAPPGGMGGSADPQVYNDYKCDVATYIFRYTRAWIEAIASSYNVWSAADAAYGTIEILVIAMNYALAAPVGGSATAAGTSIVYNAVAGGAVLTKAGATTGVMLISTPILILVGLVLMSLQALNYTISVLTADFLALMNSRKDELICALHGAKTVEEAKNNFITALGRQPQVQISFWYNQIISYVLTDALVSHLFACNPDFPIPNITGLGQLEGGCTNCLHCDDTNRKQSVQLSSVSGYNPITHFGLSPYPIEYALGPIKADIICCVCEAPFVNGSGKIEVWVDGQLANESGWGSELLLGEVVILPLEPDLYFEGQVVIKMYHHGETQQAVFTLHSISWREVV